MKMDNLKTALEEFIIKKVLKGENATQFYLEAIKVNFISIAQKYQIVQQWSHDQSLWRFDSVEFG